MSSGKNADNVKSMHRLLTEDEKVRYATLKALDHKKGGKNGDGCRVA